MLVNGGPDSLLQLTGQGLLGAGQPAVIAGDPLPAWRRPALWAVTDGQRRADTLFGLVNSNVSYTYTATETNPPAPASSAGRAARPGSCCRCRPPGTRPWPCCPARPA